MPRLFVLAGPEVGRDHRVRSGAVLGRDTTCDVVLDGRSISRRHARIVRSGGRWYVEDLDSRNGVRVGGRPVRRAELADFAELQLGELPLRFRLDAEEGGGGDAGAGPVLEGAERLDARPATAEPTGARGEDESEPAAALDERTELLLRLRRESRSGLLAGDLEQQPLAVRLALYLLALLLAAGALWLGYRGALWLRGAR